MNNGEYITLTVPFDPSLWSNLNGINGANDTTEFVNAIASVQNLGLSFGSGYFFSDGFGFNTGGSASIQLESMGATSASPEPASAFIFGGGLFAIVMVFRRKRA
jgi:hypothetical protein